MKTKILITAGLLLAAWSGFAQNDLFDKFVDNKDITQVTITKALLNMAPKMTSSVNMNGIDIKDIVSKLEQIDIFISKNSSTKALIQKEAGAYFKKNKSYELLMIIKDQKDDVVFYGQKEGEFIKSLVMLIVGDDKCVLIRLLGKFTPQDIQKITENKD